MLADLHAVAVLATVIVPLVAAAVAPAWRPRSWREVLGGVLPIAVVGAIFLSLLSARGVPIAEWALPIAGVSVVGLFARSRRLFQTTRWALFGSAIVLCLNAMALRWDGYASASASMMFQSLEQARVATLNDKLQRFPRDAEFPASSVGKILVDQAGASAWNRSTLRCVWHSWFTGLYRIDETPGEIWYTGGRVDAAKLEWRERKRRHH